MTLTKKIIEAAQPRPTKWYVVWDDEPKGFGICIHPTGNKTFVFKYRTLQGKQRMPTIGTFGALTLKQGRDIAREMAHAVRKGEDPMKQRRDGKKGKTVSEVCKSFIKEHVVHLKPNTQAQYKALIENYIKPDLGRKRVDSVDTAAVSRFLHKIGKDKPVAANRVRAVLSKMFGMCEKWGYRPQNTNPVTSIERFKEKRRHRDLTKEELRALADALTAMEEETDRTDTIAAIRLLLFCGARRGEVLNLKWSEVDLERNLLRLGDSKTGEKAIFLNSAAREVLDGVKKLVGCPYVFPANYRPEGRTVGPMPEWELREVWEQVRTKAGLGAKDGVRAFRIHDLRHSFASVGAGLGLSLPQIGALLGHKQPSTTNRYADLASGASTRAAEMVGRQIVDAMNSEPEPEGEVVELNRKEGE